MRKRNIYKDIVIGTAIVFLAVFCIKLCKVYLQEKKSYGFMIQSETELTEAIVGELQKISGICRFEPVSSAVVTIKLEEYTLETKLIGVELGMYPLRWKEVESKVVLGNTPALFFGEDVFSMFSDQNGHNPDKREIKGWMEQKQELTVTITDESGHVNKGKIFGILKSPKTMVCMDKNQMKEVFKNFCRITGGYMEIDGCQNMEKAQEVLENGGFAVENKLLFTGWGNRTR